jgi:hypothetical protein
MSQDITLKASGLNTSPNALDVAPGSMSIASNVVIRRQNVVEPRRGFQLYGSGFPFSTDRAKKIFEYQNRILRHYGNTIQFDDGTGNFTSFAGNYLEPEAGIRIKTIGSSANLYFTSSTGIQKLSALTAGDFTSNSGFITQAGGVEALDLNSYLSVALGSSTGFLPADSTVAYRIVWASRDANNNLILGVPSQRSEIYASLQTLSVLDFNRLLVALDNLNSDPTNTLITNGNWFSTYGLTNTSNAQSLATNILAVASALDTALLIGNTTTAPLLIASATDNASNNYSLQFNYKFTVTAANATVGATYTNNSQTFTVSSTIAGATTLLATGTGLPVSSGTLTKVTGTGDATIAFSAVIDPSPLNYLSVGGKIQLAGFTTTTGTINGTQTILSINIATRTITFTNPTVATGNASVLGTLNSHTYENITNTIGVGQISSLANLIINLPTPNQQVKILQDAISRIILALQLEPIGIIGSTLQALYINPLNVTTSVNVNLSFTVPQAINSQYFYQVYRSDIAQAVGTTVLTSLFPDDECALVFEAYPTAAQIQAGIVTVNDVTPEGLRGTALYTNAFSGQGALAAAYAPPFAKDINFFKNCVFYANTKTKHSMSISLLGVQNMITDYNNGTTPNLTISDGTTTVKYNFVTGLAAQTDITYVADVSNSYNATYFQLNSANNQTQYIFYYKTSGGADTRPSSGGTISAISVANPSVITSTSHGLQTGDFISISNSDSVPAVDGSYYVTVISPNSFSIPINVTSSGSIGSWTRNAIVQRITIQTNETANNVALKSQSAIGVFSTDLSVSVPTALPTIRVSNIGSGASNNATIGSLPNTCSIVIHQAGRGQNASTRQVLLSLLISVAQNIDATARSLVSVINQDPGSPVYAFYLSGDQSIPGQINLEARALNTHPFYLVGNNPNTGQGFSPDLSPLLRPTITNINPATNVISTSVPHGFTAGQQIIIINANTTPSILGVQTIAAVTSTTDFKIGVTITAAASVTASYQLLSKLTSSTDQAFKNRVYFSSQQEPEAVPLLNYFDVGSSDKAILRIFPLRDSLFVFKEDGLFRISGESAPFNLQLFDSSCFLIAPDSVAVTNNLIYCWTTQGISTVSEAGVSFAISRPIDNKILQLQTPSYSSFNKATFGVGYNSDNSYTVWTVQNPADTVATIAYRYSNLTQTWTSFNKTNTCGFVFQTDDKLYLGASDTNYIEQERKNFDRTDYADRALADVISVGSFMGNNAQLSSVKNYAVGDVFLQTQTLTAYTYNTLLNKLDADPTLQKGYTTALQILSGGVDPRIAVTSLASRLATDPAINNAIFNTSIASISGQAITTSGLGASGVITSTGHGLITGRSITISGNSGTMPSINGSWVVTVVDTNTFTIPISITTAGTGGAFNTNNSDFGDIQTCYNKLITLLNTPGTGATFNNYTQITTTTVLESIITKINTTTKTLTLDQVLFYLVGNVTIYKSINSIVQYNPMTMGDALSWKHLREATVIFNNRAFTGGVVSFATDLVPDMSPVPFSFDGPGAFGYSNFGGSSFGGIGNSAPFRTYIPRNSQRCRFLLINFTHSYAREKFEMFGITVTGESTNSSRGYRK